MEEISFFHFAILGARRLAKVPLAKSLATSFIISSYCSSNSSSNSSRRLNTTSFLSAPSANSKLTTRKLNRAIRSYIRDAGDKLRQRLKQEDIPANKIISYELFNSIVEECEIQLKEGYMEVLLYQMKMKVPKGKGFNTLNAIVIVDFLK